MNTETLLGDKKVFQFNVNVGNSTEVESEMVLKRFKEKNPLDKYEDIVCLYVPVRSEPTYGHVIRIN